MRYLILADSHGDEKAVRELKPILENVDGVIHLGDHISDLQWLQKDHTKEFYGVRGNCDGPKSGDDELVVTLSGVKILLAHGHLFGVKHHLSEIYQHGHKKNVAAVLFGHTHIAVTDTINGIIMHNPGSLSLPKDGAPRSYSILKIEAGILHFEHFYLF